jgi:pyruvate/2-oxoglutarate dehydrogenase complex dihydrolipoamide dehydrogenase (E3) component
MSRYFDAIIIGAGQAGPSLAGRLTGAGMTVALVERKLFGGTCVNTGCMLTKTLIASAYAAHVARRGADYGVMLDAPLKRIVGAAILGIGDDEALPRHPGHNERRRAVRRAATHRAHTPDHFGADPENAG